MPVIPNYGWIRDDDAVAEIVGRLGVEDSIDPEQRVFSDGESLLGYAKRQIERGNHGVFPHLSELAFRQGFTPAYRQTRGVCVGCGTARAIEDTWTHAIVQRGRYGRPVRVDVATIYAGSRTQRDLGNSRLSGDGSVGAWAAKWVHDWGAAEQRKYGKYDLTGLAETLAVQWGRQGGGVPRAVLDSMPAVVIACYYCRTADQVYDALYAGFGVAYCDSRTFGAKDADGVSRLSEPASHCVELIGACVSRRGTPLVGGQQSWGQRSPSGPSVLRYRDGEVNLRPGMCFVPLSDIAKGLESRGAEAWAFEVQEGWR
jgi:hypothetical protein